MALTLYTITGRFPYPDDTAPTSAVLRFVPTTYDVIGTDVTVPGPVRVDLDGTGNLSVSLCATDEGISSWRYQVILEVLDAGDSAGGIAPKRYDYGLIAVTFNADISTLLQPSPIAETSLTYQQIIAALDDLEADTASLQSQANTINGKAAAALSAVQIGAVTVTASLAGATWTVGWSGLRALVGTSTIQVSDLPSTSLASGEAFWTKIDAGAPYTVTKGTLETAIRNDIAFGRTILLVRNNAGALSGALADAVVSARIRGNLTTETASRVAGDVGLQTQIDGLSSAALGSLFGPFATPAAGAAATVNGNSFIVADPGTGRIDLYQNNAGSAVYVMEWSQIRFFAERSAFVGSVSDGLVLPDGTSIFADGLGYTFRLGADQIDDLPGVVPLGEEQPGHYGLADFFVNISVSQLTAARNWVSELKVAGVWGKLDAAWLPCLGDSAGRRNWKNFGRYPLTTAGQIIFTPGKHVASPAGGNGYLRTAFVPSTDGGTVMTGTSQSWTFAVVEHIASVEVSGSPVLLTGSQHAPSNTRPLIGHEDNGALRISPYGTGFAVRARFGGDLGNIGDAFSVRRHQGIYTVTRDATNEYAYKDGALIGSRAVTGTALAADEVWFLRGGSDYSTYPIAAVMGGGHLTATEVSDLHTALRRALEGIGAMVPEVIPVDAATVHRPLRLGATRQIPTFALEPSPTSAAGIVNANAVPRTTLASDGIVRPVAANTPRLHHDPYSGDFLGIISEPAASLAVPTSGDYYSEDFTETTYVKDGLVPAVASVRHFAESGTAHTLTDDTSTGEHAIAEPYTFANNRAVVFSVWSRNDPADAADTEFFFMEVEDRAGAKHRAIWSNETAFLRSASAGVARTEVERHKETDGWFRYTIIVNSGTGAGAVTCKAGLLPPAADPTAPDASMDYTGDGTRFITLGAWQVADTAATATAVVTGYVPLRAGTVVAANRDSLSYTPASAMNADEGTLFLRFKITGNPDVGGFARLLRIANSGGTTFLEIRQGSAVGSNLIVTGNGGSTFLTAIPIADWIDGREFACVLGYTQIPAGATTKRVYFGYNGSDVFNSESAVVGPADSVTPEVLHLGPSTSTSRFPIAISEVQYFNRLLPLEEMHRLIGYNTERPFNSEAWPDLWPNDPPWLKYLTREALGLSSFGVTNSPDVLEVYKSGWTVFNRVATSTTVDFCAFGLSWLFEKFGIRGTGAIKAHSFLGWGREVPLDDLKIGSVIMVTNRDADDADFNGVNHVALFLGLDPNDATQFWMGGFNQNSRRTTVQLRPVSQILAARWPTQKELVNA